MLVVLVVPGVWAPAGGRAIYVDVNATGVSDGFSRTVTYNKLQDTQVVINAPPKLLKKTLEAEGICQPDKGVHQTPGDH